MRFVRIHAKAFGPLADATLDLAPGMNVISGRNGAGKSSWQNAIYAALCGLRRGPGLRKADAAFAQRYRPWGRPNWEVTAEIARDDGTSIEIHRDLAGNVDCSICELPTGRDISAQFDNGDSPDGARLVGLDRQTFLSTASVRQAEITTIEYDAALQQQLQRAAATAGEAATAAAAIDAIERYAREHVGIDRRNSTKPLRASKDALELARRELATAEAEHADYLKQLGIVEQLRSRAYQTELESMAADAVYARREARELRAKLSRAAELTETFRSFPRPDLGADETLANEVAAAIQSYEELAGQTHPGVHEDVGALRSELNGLPTTPEGEVTPAQDVRKAFASLAEDAGENAVAPRSIFSWQLVAGFVLLVAAIFFFLAKNFALGAAALPIGTVLLAFGLLLARERRDSKPALPRGTRNEHKAVLKELLRSRGYEGDDSIALYHRYEADCEKRLTDARPAARRPDIEKRLEAAERMRSLAAGSEERLHAAASRCGIDDADPCELVKQLKFWQASRSEQRRRIQKEIEERRELTALLGVGNLADLQRDTEEQEREAEALAGRLSSADLASWKARNGSPSGAIVRQLRIAAGNAKAEAAAAEGQLTQLKRSLPDVAAARDAVAEAERESVRVEQLASTLDETKKFLQRAQEAVYNDIAPMLVSTLERWLPGVTQGLYTRAVVDPASLEVRVRSEGGAWRKAGTLSHGTCEQIYLLLRIAMTDHLTKASNETCPMLLDDVTAHCDPVRTRTILALLHELSKTRQIVLFSQERDVSEWAAEALHEPNDRLVLLAAEALAL
jgi:recombinational DNA repair ATPase RecF